MKKFITKINQLLHSFQFSFFSSKLKRICSILSVAIISIFIMGNSGGPAASGNGGRTGAPGDGTCTDCHSGGAFGTVSPVISIFKTGTTTSVTSYNADSTYDIKVTINHSAGNPAAYGFQLTVLKSGNTMAGSLNATAANTQISSSGSRFYLEHSSPNPSNIFTGQWTAPATVGTGSVTFYTYGNCVNNTGGTDGDKAGGKTLVLTEAIVAPVKISGFTIKSNKTKNILNWTSSNEINNAYFNIQYSINAKDFTTIGSVNSKANNGNSGNSIFYSFTHENAVAQHNYYRLQQVDKDGKVSFVSEIKEASFNNAEATISVFPNPVKDVANINIDNIDETILKVIDMNGVVVKELVKPNGVNNFKVNLTNLNKGIYTINVFSKGGQLISNKKIVKI